MILCLFVCLQSSQGATRLIWERAIILRKMLVSFFSSNIPLYIEKIGTRRIPPRKILPHKTTPWKISPSLNSPVVNSPAEYSPEENSPTENIIVNSSNGNNNN